MSTSPDDPNALPPYKGSQEFVNIPGKRRTGFARCGLTCFLWLVLLTALVVFAIVKVAIPFFKTGGGNADTRPVPGDASLFDPVAVLDAVRAYAGEGAQLVSIDAQFVRSDGTMDLTATYSPSPRTTYKFVRQLAQAPADAPPIGAGGKADGKWYEPISIEAYQPGQWRSVSRVGGGVSLKYSYMNEGMERDVGNPTSSPDAVIPDPQCTFSDLWKEALKKDAPSSAVASIEYDEDGYTFRISDVGIYLQFNQDCQLTR